MTTKIEITVTENDNVYFIYVYREKTLLHKFELGKKTTDPKQSRFIETMCTLIGQTVTRIVKNLIKGE